MPGPVARPVLVRQVEVLESDKFGSFGALIVSYGTGQRIDDTTRQVDLCIENPGEYKALGLHKPTRFSLDLSNRKKLLWCEEYFVAPYYIREVDVIAGSLTASQIQQLRKKLESRGLTAPATGA